MKITKKYIYSILSCNGWLFGHDWKSIKRIVVDSSSYDEVIRQLDEAKIKYFDGGKPRKHMRTSIVISQTQENK